MKRSVILRLFVVVLAAFSSLLLISYVRARTSHAEEQNCENGKCNSGKVRTEYILWESITHNLLTDSR